MSKTYPNPIPVTLRELEASLRLVEYLAKQPDQIEALAGLLRMLVGAGSATTAGPRAGAAGGGR